MSNTLSKMISILFYVLAGVSVVLVAVFYLANSALPADATHEMQVVELGNTLEYLIVWAYVLLGLATAAAVIIPLVKLFSNPKAAIKSAVSLVIIGILVAITYSFSSGELLVLPGYNGTSNTEPLLKFADTSLYTMYALLVTAVVGMVLSEISNFFK